MLGPPGSRPTGGLFEALMFALADGLDWVADHLERVAGTLTFSNVVVALLLMVPTFLAAAIAGIGSALLTRDVWPLLVVLVTGSLLGGLAMVAAFGVAAFYERWRAGLIGEVSETQALAIACTVGPAVAMLVAVTVTLSWS